MKSVYYIPYIFILCLLSSILILVLINNNIKSCTNLFFPTHLDDLKILCERLLNCYELHSIEIHIFHAICFLFLQTWCIPGTVLFNLFGGAVFGVYKGTAICLILNVIGASCSYYLSKLYLTDLFDSNDFLRDNKEKLRKLIENHKHDLIYYMIFLRLFPGSPNWLMNISFPHLDINLFKFAVSVFIGIAPWNFFSCSGGAILRELTNTKGFMSTEKYLLLLALALCFLIIPFVKNKIMPAESINANGSSFNVVKIN